MEHQLFYCKGKKIERNCPCSYAAQKDFALLMSLTLPALLISIFLFSPSFRSMAANKAEYRCSCIHSFTDHFSELHTQALSFSKHKSSLVTLITHGFLCAQVRQAFITLPMLKEAAKSTYSFNDCSMFSTGTDESLSGIIQFAWTRSFREWLYF